MNSFSGIPPTEGHIRGVEEEEVDCRCSTDCCTASCCVIDGAAVGTKDCGRWSSSPSVSVVGGVLVDGMSGEEPSSVTDRTSETFRLLGADPELWDQW